MINNYPTKLSGVRVIKGANQLKPKPIDKSFLAAILRRAMRRLRQRQRLRKHLIKPERKAGNKPILHLMERDKAIKDLKKK